jgi:hypothetical protein
MKHKEKTNAIISWLIDPQHTSEEEMADVTIKDFHIFLHSAWQAYLQATEQPCFEDDLDIFIHTQHETAPDHLLAQSPLTSFMFAITKLSDYPNVFHDFTFAAKLPFYLLHQEHEGLLFASFNPFTWENTTVCQAQDIAEFRVIALQATEEVLPNQWQETFFGPTPFLHFSFRHDMGEPLPTWDECDVNELIGWVTSPQHDT